MQLNPESLPGLATLRRRAKALAMLDAIVCPEWEYRYFSYNAAWSEGEEMASMRNGQGDEWFLLFCPNGAAVKGFARDSIVATNGVFAKEIQQRTPPVFASFLKEPAFSMEWASFCYWRRLEDTTWRKVMHPDPALSGADDGSAEHLALLVEPAVAYQEFSRDYFECELPLSSIEHIYAHAPLTGALIKALNPEANMTEVEEAALEAGYGIAE